MLTYLSDNLDRLFLLLFLATRCLSSCALVIMLLYLAIVQNLCNHSRLYNLLLTLFLREFPVSSMVESASSNPASSLVLFSLTRINTFASLLESFLVES